MFIDENDLDIFSDSIKEYLKSKLPPDEVITTNAYEYVMSDDDKYLEFNGYMPQPPEEGNYLQFRSKNSISIHVIDYTKYWDGTIEYSTDKTTWNIWDGTTTIYSASDGTYHNIYIRGIGNTIITGQNGSTSSANWTIQGWNIYCYGNIENLLDYSTVALGNHPAMAEWCFRFLFYSAPIVTCPKLPATTVTAYCYRQLFYGCSSLITLPALPAITLANNCYHAMFGNCSNIKISTTQTGEYINEYRMPTTGTGVDASSSFISMFNNTGGTFTGTPTINTTYYTSNEII